MQQTGGRAPGPTLLLLGLLAAGPATALVPEQPLSPIRQKVFLHPALRVEPLPEPVEALDGPARARAVADLRSLDLSPGQGYLDLRGGSWSALWLSAPLLPGAGVGNGLRWNELREGGRPPCPQGVAALAGEVVTRFLDVHAVALRVDPGELGMPRVAVQGCGQLVQLVYPRVIEGVPVRGGLLSATINHGNLILLGTDRWARTYVSTTPRLDSAAGEAVVREHLDGISVGGFAEPELIIVVGQGGADLAGDRTPRYEHRLAWDLTPRFDGEIGRWEALVDAHTGELLRFADTNRHGTARTVTGGVFPQSNDGTDPLGTEQPDWPMPWADLSHDGGSGFTDSGGNVFDAVGVMSTTLAGQFVLIEDDCGEILESSPGDIDLGTSGGDNCTVPPGASPGNTHAARSGFYELNRIKEQARAHLPANSWLQGQLLANTNIDLSCGAFWDGTAVNLFRSGFGCANTGELAAVFDHEWGHGMDDNDVTGSISSPAEGIADLFAALRLNTSCIGRGFFQSGANCSGYGDPCLECTGVRDIDWARRASGAPHDLDWASANCGGTDHCESAVYSEAVWDLYTRDLPGTYGMDANTALEATTRLNYLASGGVTEWWSGAAPTAGCAATTGYQQFLAAEDDNGDLGDGTPHMRGLFSSFDRHQIACPTPAVQDAGCAGLPTEAPVVTASGEDNVVELAWTAVPGASRFRIYRAEGVSACGIGKTIAGETADTSFTDAGLLNGRDYFYVVAGLTAEDSCLGPASACITAVPGPGAAIPCGDLERFQARCQVTPGGPRVQYRLILLDGSHDGEEVTFIVDGAPDVRTINGDRAQGVSPGSAGGTFTVGLANPAGCFPERVVTCP